MTKLKLIGLCILCMHFAAEAQTPIKFRKVIGNSGYDFGYYAEQTPDKGYILIGSTTSFSGSADMYAIKTDSMGIPQLHKSFGGISVEKGYSVRRTSDNGYILLGYTNSSGLGGYDMYMVKIDSLFDTQWEKTYGGADWDFGNCVRQTTDGGYIICGSTFSYGNGNQDYYLLKTNDTGDTLWTKTYGGAGDDVAKSVVQTMDGGYALTGYTKSMGDPDGDFYTIRTNSTGDTLWTNVYGGADADLAHGIIENMAGDFVVAGECTNIVAGHAVEGTVVRLAGATGAYIENNTFGGSNYDAYYSISEAADGKIAMAGKTNSFGLNGDALVVILHANFGYFSSTTYGTDDTDVGYSIEPTEDHCFIFCGHTNGYNNGLDDIYLIKTDSTGLSGFSGSETFYVTAINEQEAAAQSQFGLYPNPADNVVTLSLDNTKAAENTIVIADLTGRDVYTLQTTAANPVLELQNLPDGMYLITIKNELTSASKKLIVHH